MMMNTQDIYLWEQADKGRFLYHGIEFREWISCFNLKENLILLRSDFSGGQYHAKSNLHYILQSELPLLANDDIYKYGDFVWVDFEDERSLDALTPLNVAELLYMGHMGEPLYTPFLTTINNRFLYYAHDDGWFTSLYCRGRNDIELLLRNVIPMRLNTRSSLKDDCLEKLIPMFKEGLFFDFQNVTKGEHKILPFYVIGHFEDMDKINCSRATLSGHLVFDGRWKVVIL